MLDAGNTAIKKDRVLEEGLVQWGETHWLYNTHYSKKRGVLTVLSLRLRKSYRAALRVSKDKAM